MSLGYPAILDKVVSHALTLGVFDKVNQHEPKSAPGQGLTLGVWAESIGPADSGMASTSVRMVLNLRIYRNFLSEPADAVDPLIVDAVDQLLSLYAADFTLGGLIRNIDLLGRGGAPLSAQAGYTDMDKTIYRIMDITLPMVLNDIWTQAP